MSKSHRDQRAWKARNEQKAFGGKVVGKHRFRTKDESERDVEFNKLFFNKSDQDISWAIIGKRRRNTSRKSNQRTKQMMHQIERAKNKVQTILTLKTLSHE